MTSGKPMANLLKFSIPLLIGNFAQQMYSTVDSIIVSNFVGDNAFAAVGASMPIVNLLLVLFIAISTGAGVMVSQYFGARDKEQLSRTVGTSVVLIFIASVIIMILGVTLTPVLLTLLDTPEEIFEMAREYLTIIFWGILGGGLYNILSGILRGLGDSMYPLIFLLITTVINTVLDYVFVAKMGMGVPGAAWATIFAQGVSAVLCMVRLLRMRDVVRLNRANLKIDRALTGSLLKLGLPAGLTQAIFSLSMVVVQALSNQLGATVIATSTAVMRVDGFAMLPNFTFGMAASTFVGQNVGARRLDRVKTGTRDALTLTLISACALTLTLLLFGKYLVELFTQTETIVTLGVRAFKILACGYIAVGISQVFAGIMRGAGDTMPSMWISIFTTVCLRVPIAYIWAHFSKSEAWPNGSPDALFFSLLISWVGGAVLTYLWYRKGKWKKKALV